MPWDCTKMKIGVLGARGYVGSRFAKMAERQGHSIIPFSRTPKEGFRDAKCPGSLDFSGLDGIVNLAGEPVFGPWTHSKKSEILRSRVEGTRIVCDSLKQGPRVLVNASAIGFYGDTGETAADENSPCGNGFLADVCKAWENAAMPATEAGVRLVRLRIGFVTGPGGAMGLVRPLFKLGLGGNLGNGRQWMSCIHVDDVAGMILWALENNAISGAVNAVNPDPVRNSEFTRILAKVLHRPAIFPAPAFALRLALGELSSLLLNSSRVVPEVALKHGYCYIHPTLEHGLRAEF